VTVWHQFLPSSFRIFPSVYAVPKINKETNVLRVVYDREYITVRLGFHSAIKVATFLLFSLVENDSSLMGKNCKLQLPKQRNASYVVHIAGRTDVLRYLRNVTRLELKSVTSRTF
jgi:hypothetical protein